MNTYLYISQSIFECFKIAYMYIKRIMYIMWFWATTCNEYVQNNNDVAKLCRAMN